MTDTSPHPAAWPYRWWLAVLVGVAPHGVLLVYIARPRVTWFGYFDTAGGAEALLPYAFYGWAELFIVPVSLLVVVAFATVGRTRPWAISLLLGCLGGATAVLMALAVLAARWHLSFELGAAVGL